MQATTEHFRREALQVEQMAKCISLRPDKDDLLAQAQLQRRQAEEMAARVDRRMPPQRDGPPQTRC